MICPVCSKEMTQEDFGGTLVDFCRDGCQGIWFDWMEIVRLDEVGEGAGENMQKALDLPHADDAARGPIKCPKCGITMHAHKYKAAKDVTVDECYSCGGFFLDAGELKAIKDRHMTEQQEADFAAKLMSGNPQWNDANAGLKKQQARASAIHGFTRYLSPSRFFTGK